METEYRRFTLTLPWEDFERLIAIAEAEERPTKWQAQRMLRDSIRIIEENGDSGQILAEQTAAAPKPSTAQECEEGTT